MSDADVTPLAERLVVADESVPGPPAWMQVATAHAEPLAKVLDQSRRPASPLDEPEVRAELDAAIGAAEAAAREAAEAASAELYERLEKTIATIEETCLSAARLQASELASAAIVVASTLVGRALEVDEDAIAELVHQCLANIVDTGRTVIRLHPDDLARLEGDERLGERASLLAEPTLARGECVVETPEQRVDARVEARLERMRGSLVDLFRGESC